MLIHHLFHRHFSYGFVKVSLIFIIVCLGCTFAVAQINSPAELKKLSLEELLNTEVTLVSRSPQKLLEAASPVQIISAEAIRNSGADNIADALRLVTNLQVAQLNSNAWLIGSRGFNTVFANKLLVMIDGRTVYTPLFAGVFWNMQNVLLEDIDRIEVVSGPGGVLWGANAVNGVINIVTKSSKQTNGLYVSALAGTFIKDHLSARWGGKIGDKLNYRIYGQHFDRSNTFRPDGSKSADAWGLTQGGFRMDWEDNHTNNYVVQGDYGFGKVKSTGTGSAFDNQNILGRWTRSLTKKTDFSAQLYFDRYFQADGPGKSSDEMKTVDLDLQFRFAPAKQHSILLGMGYRLVDDRFVSQNQAVAILPSKKRLDLFTGFIQDEIVISPHLTITAGTKVLHNVYTGVELQPGIRTKFTLKKSGTLWASVSRAVRTPSRIDVDYYSPVVPQPPNVVSVAGGPAFKAEKAIAYELGYRVQPNQNSSLSIAAFYNKYRDVYSLETLPGTQTYQISNGSEGTSWGTEISGTYQLTKSWRIRGGYTYFKMNLKAKKGRLFDPSYLANDVPHQAMLQSMLDLGPKLHLDAIGRYLDYLPQTLTTIRVPSYFAFDARLAYTIKFAEISVVGQNLFSRRHTEFSNSGIPRSVYVKLALRL